MNEKRKCSTRLIILLICLLLSACQKEVTSALEIQKITGYTLPQTMIIVATERNRYQSIYTAQIWDVGVEDGSETFETYLLRQVQLFLQDIRTMNLLAESEEIEISSLEIERLKKLAKKYHTQLTNADQTYIKCSETDVYQMYKEYYTANKVVEVMTKDIDLEISDNESKVIGIYQVELEDQETANEVYQQLQAEGADFRSLAQQHSANPVIERYLGRGEESKLFEEAAFALNKGEMSEILPVDETYYILFCFNDYDQEATKKRKNEIYTAKRSQVFRQLYLQYTQDHPIEFQDSIWQSISCKTDQDTTTCNFFELYHEEFGS